MLLRDFCIFYRIYLYALILFFFSLLCVCLIFAFLLHTHEFNSEIIGQRGLWLLCIDFVVIVVFHIKIQISHRFINIVVIYIKRGMHACLWPILRLIFLVNLIINIDKSVRGFVLCQRRNLVSLCMQTYLTMHFFFLTFSIGKIVVFFSLLFLLL